MNRALAVLLVVGLAHYLYAPLSVMAGEPHQAASWLFYIFRGIEGAVVLGLLAGTFNGPGLLMGIGAFACWLGVAEELQTAVCGAISFGVMEDVPVFSGLCVERFGGLPYAATAAALLVYFMRRRHAGKSRPRS